MGNKQTPGTIVNNAAQLVRTVTAADPNYTDASCDPTTAIITTLWKRIRVFAKFTGGVLPTIVFQPLHRVTPVNGSGWMLDAQSAAVADGVLYEIEVGGRDVFIGVAQINGAPSSVAIYCVGWEPVRRLSALGL